jgi:hypothetical protein
MRCPTILSMERIEVEVYSRTTEDAILRFPQDSAGGIFIPASWLAGVVMLADETQTCLDAGDTDKARECHRDLAEYLRERWAHCEEVLIAAGAYPRGKVIRTDRPRQDPAVPQQNTAAVPTEAAETDEPQPS